MPVLLSCLEETQLQVRSAGSPGLKFFICMEELCLQEQAFVLGQIAQIAQSLSHDG